MNQLFEKKQDWTNDEIQNIEYSMLKGPVSPTATIRSSSIFLPYATTMS